MGTPIFIEEQSSPSHMEINDEVVEWQENKKLAIQMFSGTGVKSYKQVWSLDPTSTGSWFTFMEKIELPFGIIGKLIGFLGEGMSVGTVDKMFAKLKALVEA